MNKLKTILPIITFFLFCLSTTVSAQMLQCKQEEKTLTIAEGNLYGTLRTPPIETKVPLAIIIAGSGPTDRNGVADSYKQLAEQLCKNDIATFSYDKRMIGKSKMDLKEEDATLEVFVDDLCAWIKLFEADENYSEIVLIGHSEGGLLSLLAAQNMPSVKKVVSLSGAGRPLQEVLKEQLSAQMKGQTAALDQAFSYIDLLAKGEKIKDVAQPWYVLFRPSVQPFMISSFRYDPAKEITKLKAPVLIISGGTDIQISDEDAKKLSEASPSSKLVIIPEMNHTLKLCKSRDLSTQLKAYQDKTMPISTELVTEITTFIEK